jgi:hypothetical protein
MSQDSTRRAVDAALVPVVASLAAWEVTEAHWLPDRDGVPVIWLRTRTRAQQDALARQVWLVTQLQTTLTRLGVPYAVVRAVRVEVTSGESEAQLFVE